MARWLTRVLPLQARCPSLPAQPPLAGLLHLPRDPCLTRLASPTDRDLQEARQAKLAAKPLSAQALQEGMAAVRREDPLHTGHVRQNCGVCPACRQVRGCWGCGHGGACCAGNCRPTRRAGRLATATNGVDWRCCCCPVGATGFPPCPLHFTFSATRGAAAVAGRPRRLPAQGDSQGGRPQREGCDRDAGVRPRPALRWVGGSSGSCRATESCVAYRACTPCTPNSARRLHAWLAGRCDHLAASSALAAQLLLRCQAFMLAASSQLLACHPAPPCQLLACHPAPTPVPQLPLRSGRRSAQ